MCAHSTRVTPSCIAYARTDLFLNTQRPATTREKEKNTEVMGKSGPFRTTHRCTSSLVEAVDHALVEHAIGDTQVVGAATSTWLSQFGIVRHLLQTLSISPWTKYGHGYQRALQSLQNEVGPLLVSAARKPACTPCPYSETLSKAFTCTSLALLGRIWDPKHDHKGQLLFEVRFLLT
jgi:hypothetical protein